jgi:hypothetical protein
MTTQQMDTVALGEVQTDEAATKLLFLVLHRTEKAWIMPPR